MKSKAAREMLEGMAESETKENENQKLPPRRVEIIHI